jgi:hypothetical protein
MNTEPIQTIIVPRKNIFVSYLLKIIISNLIFAGAFYFFRQSRTVFDLFQMPGIIFMFIPIDYLYPIANWIVWVLFGVLLYRLLCTILDSKLIPTSEFHHQKNRIEIGLMLFVMIATPMVPSEVTYHLIQQTFPSLSKLQFGNYIPNILDLHFPIVGGLLSWIVLNLYNLIKLITLLVCKVQGVPVTVPLFRKQGIQFLIFFGIMILFISIGWIIATASVAFI